MKRLLCLAALVLACSRPDIVLPNVARPDNLADLDAPVRSLFDQRHATLERTLADRRSTGEQRARAFGSVGQVHFAYRYLDTAAAAFTAAIQLDPEEPRWLYYRARVEETRGDGGDVEPLLEQVLEVLPDHSPSRLILADRAAERGELEKAESGYLEVLERDPTNVRARAALAKLALQAGDPSGALEHLEEALARQPTAAPLHYQAALIFRHLGDDETAQRHLKRVPSQNVAQVQLIADDPWMLEIDRLLIGARHHDQRAMRALASGRFELAILELRQALAANPERIYARHGLGAALAQLGRVEEALAELDLLVEQAPHHVPTLVLLAKILIDEDRPDEARRYLEEALELAPTDADTLRQMARLPT